MPARRPHPNSHHGCQDCKRRKIKCDEARPECGPCLRKRLPCSFRLDSYHQSTVAIIPSSPHGQTLALNPLPLLELQLLHQWYTCTAPELSENPEVRRVMTVTIPQEGFTNPFLMHGVLAIAALHRVQLQDPKDTTALVAAAIQHKQWALSLYTPLLSNITESNCKALFAFSCLLSILSFASQSQRVTRTVKNVADIVDILGLVRGVGVIVIVAKQWIQSSEMGALLLPGQFKPSPDADNDTSSRIGDVTQWQLLLEYCRTTCKDDDSMPVYLEAIQFLTNNNVARSATVDYNYNLILAWPTRINSQFFGLLLKRDQLALVIFAHYGAVMVLLDDAWWLKGWGQLVIALVSETLPPSEVSHITWPLKLALKKRIYTEAVLKEGCNNSR